MKLILVDEKGKSLAEQIVDADSVLETAEQGEGDTFVEGTRLIKQAIQNEHYEYEVDPSADSSIANCLRQFAALGRVKETPTVRMLKRKGDDKRMQHFQSDVFEEVRLLPDKGIQERYDRLVGLDELKEMIRREASLLVAPDILQKWSKQYHGGQLEALKVFADRYPFFIFEGDVGTGKTEFAETFGNDVARLTKREVLLARVSMKSRGNGVVGEMSKLISKTFTDVKELAVKQKRPVILLLDEADSLAQSREESQMHHEDRAGVNALIQGIDKIRESEVPVMVVFCTNRLQSIDPALKRRAALIHTFSRPNEDQRREVFLKYLSELKLTPEQLTILVEMTGPHTTQKYGYTYSDLITRVIPNAILAAYPDKPLSYEILGETLRRTHPTPPFQEVNQ